MKKNILTIIFALMLIVGTIFSCKKEKPANYVLADTITFGNTTNMDVVEYDTTMHFVGCIPIILDLDKDGQDDIKLKYDNIGSMIMDGEWVQIRCLHDDIELLGEDIEEDIYKHRDTTISVWSSGGVSVDVITVYTNCGKIADDDILESTKSWFKLTDCDESVQMSTNDNFKVYDNALYRDDIWYDAPMPYYSSNDTDYYDVTRYVYQCTNFPENEVRYIGFKLTKDEISRLGWLKLELLPGYQIVDTKLLETAIQK